MDRVTDERAAGGDARNETVGERGVEAEAPRQQEGQDEAAARSPAQRDQVLIDREVALTTAGLLREKAHEVLDQTWQDQLEAAADWRERNRGRVHPEGRRDPTKTRPAAARDRDEAAAERDQREIERNMVQPPDTPAE